MDSIFDDKDILEEMIHKYTVLKISCYELSKQYNVADDTISRYLRKNNIIVRNPSRLKTVDNHYFNKIDTEHKAYFLGLLFADGNVHDKGLGKGQKVLNINLQERDKYILEIFRKELKMERELSVRRYDNTNYQTAYVIHVTSNEICNDLIRMGCVPRKSLILKFPNFKHIPKSLFHHFIRGYFDGDGYVGQSMREHWKSPQCNVSFCGSKDFITGLKDFFIKLLKRKDRKISKKGNTKCYDIDFSGNNITKEIYNYLYKDATVFLTRKKDKFIV